MTPDEADRLFAAFARVAGATAASKREIIEVMANAVFGLARLDAPRNIARAARLRSSITEYASEVIRLAGKPELAVGDEAVILGLALRVDAQRKLLDAMPFPRWLYVSEHPDYIMVIGKLNASDISEIRDCGAKVEQHLGLDNCWKVTA